MLKGQLDKHNVNYRVISDYPLDELNVSALQKLVNGAPIEKDIGKKYNPLIKHMSISCISKMLKHYKVFSIIKTLNNFGEINMIIEDDCIIKNVDELISVMDEFNNSDNDLCFLSDTQKHAPNGPNTITKLNNATELPFISSACYLIKSKAAEVLASNFIPIKFETNVQLSFIAESHNLNVAMSKNLVQENSKFGVTKSTTSVDNVPIFDDKWISANKLINKTELTAEENVLLTAFINEEFDTSRPDYTLLQALYSFKSKDYSKSKLLFDKVYEIYDSMNLSLTKDYIFMQNYIELFKFNQKI
jgi:hypothetical protein